MQRSRFIDIAKGISMIMVVITHFEWTLTQRLDYGFYFWISMAVPCFMLATGYVNAASFSAKGITLKEAYKPKTIWKKIVRFSIPFLYMYAVELIIRAFMGEFYNPLEVIGHFFTGGMGVHGTYYFPVLLQLVFLMPLIYYTVNKSEYGWLICFGVNLVFEIVKNTFAVDNAIGGEIYRLLAFRYIFAVAMGAHIYLHKDSIKKFGWIMMFIVGAIYIYVIGYTPYEPVIFTRWNTTSMITVFYIAPIFFAGIKYFDEKRCIFLEKIGNASYHIFLFQIIYYNFIAPYIYEHAGRGAVSLIISVTACLLGGFGYYMLYNSVSKKWRKSKR